MIRIGTPYQSNATKVLLLGSGELGKEIAISLQRLGIEVHAADRYADAPAMHVAHACHVLDMTDAKALKQLIDTIKPTMIVPEVEAIATEALLSIEERGITVIPTARATSLTMNRKNIRKLASEALRLPTSAYRFANNASDFHDACQQIGYPCFVKPIMSSSGKGQSRLTSADDIDQAWSTAINAGRIQQANVIIEKQIDFDFEITLLTVRAIDVATQKVTTCFCDPIGHRQENGDYVESWQPQPMSDSSLSQARKIAKCITDEIGGLGVFGVELFVKGDQVWFSEVSPRPHDTGMVTLASQYQSEFDLHARAILGLQVNPARHSAAASAVIHASIDSQAPAYDGLNQALAIKNTDVRLFGKPQSHKKRRMGVAVARACNIEQARINACAAAKQIKISNN